VEGSGFFIGCHNLRGKDEVAGGGNVLQTGLVEKKYCEGQENVRSSRKRRSRRLARNRVIRKWVKQRKNPTHSSHGDLVKNRRLVSEDFDGCSGNIWRRKSDENQILNERTKRKRVTLVIRGGEAQKRVGAVAGVRIVMDQNSVNLRSWLERQ